MNATIEPLDELDKFIRLYSLWIGGDGILHLHHNQHRDLLNLKEKQMHMER